MKRCPYAKENCVEGLQNNICGCLRDCTILNRYNFLKCHNNRTRVFEAGGILIEVIAGYIRAERYDGVGTNISWYAYSNCKDMQDILVDLLSEQSYDDY